MLSPVRLWSSILAHPFDPNRHHYRGPFGFAASCGNSEARGICDDSLLNQIWSRAAVLFIMSFLISLRSGL
jgi:hypothetical protein